MPYRIDYRRRDGGIFHGTLLYDNYEDAATIACLQNGLFTLAYFWVEDIEDETIRLKETEMEEREAIEAIEAYQHFFPHLVHGLRAYLELHQETGGFLRAVLENNLTEAVMRMDRDMPIEMLRALVELVWNYFPSRCHGSPEVVAAWLKERNQPQ